MQPVGTVKWQVSGGAAERYEENLVPVIFISWALKLLNRAELNAPCRA